MTENIKMEASPEAFLLLVGKSAEQTREYLANKKSLADTMHKLIVTEDTLARIERQATHYEEMSRSLEIEAAKHQVSVIKLEEEVDRLNFIVQQAPRKEELNEYIEQLKCAKEEINILEQDQKFTETLIDVIRDREKGTEKALQVGRENFSSLELKLHNERLSAKEKIDTLDDQVEHLKVQVEDSLKVQAFMESNLDPTEAQKKIYYLEKELEKTRKECDTNAGIIYNMHGQIAALAKRPACEKNSDTLIVQLINGVRRNDRRNVVNPVRALTGLKLSEVCRLVYPIMEWSLAGMASHEPRKRIMDYSVRSEPIALGDGTETKDDSIIDEAIRYGANGGGPRVFEGVPPTKADQLYDRFGHAPTGSSAYMASRPMGGVITSGPYSSTVPEVKPREIEPTPNVDLILGGTWREGLPPHCDQTKECETCASLPCRCADKEKDQICNYTWRPSAKEAADEVTRLLESKKDDNIPMGG